MQRDPCGEGGSLCRKHPGFCCPGACDHHLELRKPFVFVRGSAVFGTGARGFAHSATAAHFNGAVEPTLVIVHKG
jgi:hypothetical protein